MTKKGLKHCNLEME